MFCLLRLGFTLQTIKNQNAGEKVQHWVCMAENILLLLGHEKEKKNKQMLCQAQRTQRND